jgi:hypothetical protein
MVLRSSHIRFAALLVDFACSVCLAFSAGFVQCWGAAAFKTPPLQKFSVLAASADQTCGINATSQITCWFRQVPDAVALSLSLSHFALCVNSALLR